jgi:hypothetical protein
VFVLVEVEEAFMALKLAGPFHNAVAGRLLGVYLSLEVV